MGTVKDGERGDMKTEEVEGDYKTLCSHTDACVNVRPYTDTHTHTHNQRIKTQPRINHDRVEVIWVGVYIGVSVHGSDNTEVQF